MSHLSSKVYMRRMLGVHTTPARLSPLACAPAFFFSSVRALCRCCRGALSSRSYSPSMSSCTHTNTQIEKLQKLQKLAIQACMDYRCLERTMCHVPASPVLIGSDSTATAQRAVRVVFNHVSMVLHNAACRQKPQANHLKHWVCFQSRPSLTTIQQI